MFNVDLTTLFGITPVNNAPITPVNFRGSERIGTFNFGLEGSRDSFIYNPLNVELKDASKIKKLAKANDKINKILKENNIKLNVNMDALSKLYTGHMADSRLLVALIFSELPIEMKQGIKGSDLQDAAMLHDYGKVLIPEKVYNKNGALTPEEKKMMNLHSELGYELLKAQGVRESVCKLVKYHHQKPDGSGYPAIDDDFEYDTGAQIHTAADKYDALTENRGYREKPYSRDEALEIIYKQDVIGKNKTISQEVFDALKMASSKFEAQKAAKEQQLQTTH